MVVSETNTAFCSRVAQAAGFHPIGTAPTYLTHLVIECEVPWAREVTDSATFPTDVREVIERAARDGIEPRVTGIIPDPAYSQVGLTRLISYAHGDGQSPTYAKREYLVPPERLAELGIADIQSRPSAIRCLRTGYRPHSRNPGVQPWQPRPLLRDVWLRYLPRTTREVCGPPARCAARVAVQPPWGTSHGADAA